MSQYPVCFQAGVRPWAARIPQQPPARPMSACARLSSLLSNLPIYAGGPQACNKRTSAASRVCPDRAACMRRWERAQGCSRPPPRAHPRAPSPAGSTM
jgi:hypothetical protein